MITTDLDQLLGLGLRVRLHAVLLVYVGWRIEVGNASLIQNVRLVRDHQIC